MFILNPIIGDTKLRTEDSPVGPDAQASRRLLPYDFAINQPDNDGNIVEKIYSKFPGYVVYRTKNNIRIDINDHVEKKDFYEKNHYKLGFKLANINSLLPEDLSATESINRLVGRAITLNVAGEYPTAIEVLNHAESRIVKLRTVEGRLQYTISAFVSMALIVVAYFITYGLKCWLSFGKVFSLELFEVMTCGAIGGFLSIAVGYGSLKIDVDAGNWTNRIIGLSRIVIAIIASIFIYFAIKSNILFSFLNDQDTNHGIFAISMVAGFIEMLVPKIMSNLGKDATPSVDSSQERS